MSWYQKNKQQLELEFPDMDNNQRMKKAFERFKTQSSNQSTNKQTNDEVSKKRKLSEDQIDENNQPKRTTSSKSAAFA